GGWGAAAAGSSCAGLAGGGGTAIVAAGGRRRAPGQAQRVEGHQQRGQGHAQRRQPRGDQPGGGQRDRQHVVGGGPGQVLADDGAGAAGQRYRRRDAQQALAGGHQVGGAVGERGALAHGDGDVG